jgi:hypothetical protein
MLQRLVVAGLAVLVAATPAAAQTGIVTGAVIHDSTFTGIAGAEVTIAGTNLRVMTGEDGRFVIARAPVGPLQLEVSRPGYRRASVACLEIADRGTTRIVIGLDQLPRDSSTVVGDPVVIAGRRPPLIVLDSVPHPGIQLTRYRFGEGILPGVAAYRLESIEVRRRSGAAAIFGPCASEGAVLIATYPAGTVGVVSGTVGTDPGGPVVGEMRVRLAGTSRWSRLGSDATFWMSAPAGDVLLEVVDGDGVVRAAFPCRLRVPPDDSIRVRIPMPSSPVAQVAADRTQPAAPLIVIDDVIHPPTRRTVLQPETITSLEVEKREMAAVRYGECGVNGVIRVTTRPPGR